VITCPTCANRMVTYPNDWRVCLACAVFDRPTPDLEPRQPDLRDRGATAPTSNLAPLDPVGAWQS
jgi:hypothetical protein